MQEDVASRSGARRIHAIVRGDVQGVGYRYTMRMVARDAGASGWVRNRADGTVEAEIEASPAVVDEVLAWMSEGPPGSRVEGAVITDIPVASSTGFDVRPTA